MRTVSCEEITGEVGSGDTEGLVEIDGESEGRLVLKEETKLELVAIADCQM